VTLIAAAPAIILGWYATTTVVAAVGGVVGLLLAAAIWFMRPQAEEQDAVDDLDAQDLVDLGL
jgi:HAMP domain-containing protein